MFFQKKIPQLVFIFLGVILASFLTTSCQKEKIESFNDSTLKYAASARSSDNCLQGIESKEGVLIFSSVEHFTETYNCLKETYQNNTAEFVELHESLGEEELIARAIEENFSEERPLINFEASFKSYVSLRKSLEGQEKEWLASEELLEKEDPYYDLGVDKILASMFNANMEVNIGGETIRGDRQIIESQKCPSFLDKGGLKKCARRTKFIGRLFLNNINFGGLRFSYVGASTRAYRKFLRRWRPALGTLVYARKKGDVLNEKCTSRIPVNHTVTSSNASTYNVQFFLGNIRYHPNMKLFKSSHGIDSCANNLILYNW